ncbi:MAG: hypothetical protein PVJ38_00975 [Candidatus Bathyarchaeota archaeon]|jgi:hypothetical protein
MDKELLEYLDGYPSDELGTAWVLVSQIEKDTSLSRQRICEEVAEARERGFVKDMRTLERGPIGLISVTITGRGRSWLQGED